MNVPPAAPVGSDVVYLKGGGMIRGSLVEAIPSDHATVELATGQTAVIPWDRIARIDRGGVSPAPSVPGPVLGTPVPHAPEATATVHVQSESPVVVERREGREWVFACSSPCNAELPLSGLYRIRGTDVRNTSAFHLNARPGDTVVLDVNGASQGNFTSVGGAAMLIGALVLYVVAVFDWADQAQNVSTPSGDGTANTVGGVMLAGGAAAVVVGVILLSRNMHSKVEQAQEAPPPPRNDAWLRAPTWRDDKSASQAPKMLGVPLLQIHF
jgi:hypothetical protein